jgi:hypothetical protein
VLPNYRPFRFVVFIGALCGTFLTSASALSQGQGASISFQGQRAFVTGFTPIIGRNGGVGGVDVDADGVLGRAQAPAGLQLAEERNRALQKVAANVRRLSPMRKVSLQRLENEIAEQVAKRQPLSSEVLFLAGLQRIEYVFVYPELHDIVVAGPAEGWLQREGVLVGQSTGEAVLRLDDLLDALQSTAAAAEGGGISCSIDPTAEGMARLQRIFKRRNLQPSDAALREMERQLGDQSVSVTGIRPNGHFARVMVGADYMMKRLAMQLERSPVADLPSYMQLLHRGSSASPVSAPRWWLVPDYQSVEKGADDLAWRFRGRGMRANSEYGYIDARGELVNAGRADPLTKLWAEKFTASYDRLAQDMPVFSQLCGCVDLAILAALVTRENLLERAGCPLLMLTDPGKLIGEELSVARRVRSQASAVRGRRGWVVSVSGGVDLETKSVLDTAEENPKLVATREAAIDRTEHWWWD